MFTIMDSFKWTYSNHTIMNHKFDDKLIEKKYQKYYSSKILLVSISNVCTQNPIIKKRFR